MWSILIRVVIGLLLIIHGFAHWQITTGWGAWSEATSWLLGGLGEATVRSVGTFLWVVALLIFIAAGLALFVNQDWWRPLAIGAAAVSLLTMVLYWQPALAAGVLVDVGILAALLWAHWPTPEMVGV